jgi:hypothetical protein
MILTCRRQEAVCIDVVCINAQSRAARLLQQRAFLCRDAVCHLCRLPWQRVPLDIAADVEPDQQRSVSRAQSAHNLLHRLDMTTRLALSEVCLPS